MPCRIASAFVMPCSLQYISSFLCVSSSILTFTSQSFRQSVGLPVRGLNALTSLLLSSINVLYILELKSQEVSTQKEQLFQLLSS